MISWVYTLVHTLATPLCTNIYHYKYIYLTHAEPVMFDLTKIVIPNVMNEWEYIAEALRYDLSIISAINSKEKENPKKCCRELLKDWLTTKNGSGPKVWSTLLDALKQIDEIAIDITENITEKVKSLKLD